MDPLQICIPFLAILSSRQWNLPIHVVFVSLGARGTPIAAMGDERVLDREKDADRTFLRRIYGKVLA